VKEYTHQASVRRAKKNKLASTKRRLEKHTLEDLMSIAAEKCVELGLDFEANRETLMAALHILHDQRAI
jgi:hypothetical protein